MSLLTSGPRHPHQLICYLMELVREQSIRAIEGFKVFQVQGAR